MDYPTPHDEPNESESARVPPETAPAGDLSEPPRYPPTAVGTFAASPEPRPPRPTRHSRVTRKARVTAAVNAMLDVLDGLGDAVRTAAARALR